MGYWASMIWSIVSVAALRRRDWGATLLSTGSHESCVHCRQPEIKRTELWSWVVDEICVAGSSPHWTAVFCDWVAKSQSWCAKCACAGTPWSTREFRDHVVPAALCSRCYLYERVWSKITSRYNETKIAQQTKFIFTTQRYASAVLAMGLCLSVTSRSSTKTAKRRITQTTPHDSPGNLVFWCQRSLWNSTGITP